MKRVIRLKDKKTGIVFSYSTVAELVKRNGEERLGIGLNALYNAMSKNDGKWENKEYEVYYEDICLGKNTWV